MPLVYSKYAQTKKYDTPLYPYPSSVQEVWPVKMIDESGIFGLNDSRYSKLFKLTDINFAGVTDAEQKNIIINFSRVLNSMNCRFSYTVANEYVDEKEFNEETLYTKHGTDLDGLSEAFNEVIKNKLTDAKQGLYQTIYLTLTIKSDSVAEARSSFGSIEAALRSSFIQLGINGMSGSQILALDINQRMQLWYNFTHMGLDTDYKFDYFTEKEKLHSWLDIVSPGTITFYNEYMRMNGYYGKVMYLSEISKSLESDTLTELSKINCTSYITVNSELLDINTLKQEINRKHSLVGIQIEGEKQRNRNKNDFLSDASRGLLKQQESLDGFLKAIEDGDDHYFNTTIMVMFFAKTRKALAKICDKIESVASKRSCAVSACFNMQREGMNSAFMFGVQEFKRCTNLSAPCLAMFMPYKTQELNDEHGNYYGINQLSQNAIFGNRKRLMNYNGLILGKSGSGKSMFAKSEIISTYINNPDDQVIIIDPQNEYKKITREVNGTRISFDSQKNIFVNPLDVDFKGVDYAELQEIIRDKFDFILTLLSSCMRRNLDSDEQGVLDNAVQKVFSNNYSMRKKLNGEYNETTEFNIPEYMKVKETVLPIKSDLTNEEQIREYSPILQDIYQELIDEDSLISRKLASHMNIFVNGSLNLFNHRTNVDLNKRFLVFDLSSIKKNLRVTAMLVMLEIVNNKAKDNFTKGLWTHLYIDEFHELLNIDSVAEFVVMLFKEIRKHLGVLTGITQNMTDLLKGSESSSKNLTAILSNSEYFALLNQSSIDRDILMRFLPQISPAMFNYVESAAPGTGLLKMGSVTVPFDMRMSKECKIYKIINTDGNDDQTAA